ncbi:MAG: hypothetical protein ACOC0O_03440 [Spirochaetota bacterium]
MSINDRQARRLRKLMEHHGQLNISAAAAGMDEKTARKYLRVKRPANR